MSLWPLLGIGVLVIGFATGVNPLIAIVAAALTASADNVGAFFGEDIFIAVSSILLIKGFLQQSGFDIAPLRLSLWAIPTAVTAFAIHGFRLWRLDARLKRLATGNLP